MNRTYSKLSTFKIFKYLSKISSKYKKKISNDKLFKDLMYNSFVLFKYEFIN